jgi:hypothetical protein
MLTVLGFLARSIFVHYLSKDIERHKAELVRATHEHQIRFNKIYEKQAEVIAELYRRLVQAHRLLGPVRMAKNFTPEYREAVDSAFAAYWDALRYFDDNAIYFEEGVFHKVKDFSAAMLKVAGVYGGLADMMDSLTTSEQIRKRRQEIEVLDGKTLDGVILEMFKSVDEQTPQLTADLLKEFRRLLGVATS